MFDNPYESPSEPAIPGESEQRRFVFFRPFEIAVYCLLAAMIVAAVINRLQFSAGYTYSVKLAAFQALGVAASALIVAPVCLFRAFLFMIQGQRILAVINLLLPLLVVAVACLAWMINPSAFIR